jgi:hypothetical protein
LNSEAALRCSSAHFFKDTNSYRAWQSDELNRVSNGGLYGDKSLYEMLTRDNSDRPLSERVQFGFQKWKLKRNLKPLKDLNKMDRYELENFSAKFRKLKFVFDPSANKNMTTDDQDLVRAIQHSIVTLGFEQNQNSQAVKSRLYKFVSTVFHEKYWRWTWIVVPKLNGVVIPFDLAMKAARDGIDAHREELAPYLTKVRGKAMFNELSRVCNLTLAALVFIGLPYYGYYKWTETYEKATAQAVEMQKPLYESSLKISQPNYFKDQADKMDDEYYKEEFVKGYKELYGHEPSQREIEISQDLRQKLKAKPGSQELSQPQLKVAAPAKTEFVDPEIFHRERQMEQTLSIPAEPEEELDQGEPEQETAPAQQDSDMRCPLFGPQNQSCGP